MAGTYPDDTSTVSSGASAPPPKRGRRTVSSVSATVAAPPVAVPADEPEPVEAELTDDDTGQTKRGRRRKKAKQAVVAEAPLPEPAPSLPAMPTVAPYGERRVRQTIQKVDLWTVTKLSLCFYVSAMFVTLVALVALWMIAETAGIIDSIEDFLGDLLSAEDFTFLSGEVLRGTILVSLVVVALQVVMTIIAASFYNIFAELFGGLEITIKEEELPER